MLELFNRLLRRRETIRALAVCPDHSKCVVGACGEAQLVKIDQLDHSLQRINNHPYGIGAVDWSPDGQFIVTAGYKTYTDRWLVDNSIQFWDANIGAHAGTLEHEFTEIFSVAFSPNSKLLAVSGSDLTNEIDDHKSFFVGVWEIGKNRRIAKYGPYRVPVLSVTFSPDGNLVAGGMMRLPTEVTMPGGLITQQRNDFDVDDLATIRIWKVEDSRECGLIDHQGTVRCLRFSPSGKSLVTAGDECLLWDTLSGECPASFDLAATFHDCSSIDISRCGEYLATGSGSQALGDGIRNCFVRVWSLNTKAELQSFERSGPVGCVAFVNSSASLAIVAGGDRGELRLHVVAPCLS